MKRLTRHAIPLLLLVVAIACLVTARAYPGAVQQGKPPVAPQITLACYFSPEGGAKDAIVKEIDGAKKEILVAMYDFTSPDIAKALVRAKERGVSVRVVLDKGQNIHEGSKAHGRQSAYLAQNGIEVSFDSASGLMHDKFAVIDRREVLTGSYNWTAGAEKKNAENLLVIQSEETAAQYAADFDEVMSHCDNADAGGTGGK